MNKTLLLILCDFLLLTLLAHTRWDQIEEPGEAGPPDRSVVTRAPATGMEGELMLLLQSSLEEEQMAREAMLRELEAARESLVVTRETLVGREETLEEREARLRALEESLSTREEEAMRLARQLSRSEQVLQATQQEAEEARREAALQQVRLQRLQEELVQRQSEGERLQQQLEEVEQSRRQVEEQARSLDTQVQILAREREFLQDNILVLRDEVAIVREEKNILQQQAGALAAGVTQLAETSAGIRQEIRSNTPINANTLFSNFLESRITGSFEAFRRVAGGPVQRVGVARSVLVSDGEDIFVLFHIENTALNMQEARTNWSRLRGILRRGDTRIAIERIHFHARDPRIILVPIDQATADRLGGEVYLTALEPFRFPEAVLINSSGEYYGEVEFRLDAQNPNYVRMQTRVFSRLFGEFSPSVGDLVLSKTGELLGIMVNRTHCVLIDNFVTVESLGFGEPPDPERTSEVLQQVRNRLIELPSSLR